MALTRLGRHVGGISPPFGADNVGCFFLLFSFVSRIGWKWFLFCCAVLCGLGVLWCCLALPYTCCFFLVVGAKHSRYQHSVVVGVAVVAVV